MTNTVEANSGSEKDAERAVWLKVSEEGLNKVWDNERDAVFDELLDERFTADGSGPSARGKKSKAAQ